ncbi:MAG: glutamine-hydrolyzing carbamoyl-phosphate synthase small subunit [Desulfitobacteriaceae bacterium]
MPYVVLKDGRVFEGEAFGAWPGNEEIRSGEVVFNTSMSGYQEIITDLSYAGQIIVFTHPQIGNYGWHDEENEADKILLRGIIVRELSAGEGSLHANRSLEDFCDQNQIWGLKGVDTRALTKHIRQQGTLPGVLVRTAQVGLEYWNNLKEKNSEQPAQSEEASVSQLPLHWVYQTTIRESYEIPGEGPLLAVLDFGAKRNILRQLHLKGFRLKVFPASTGSKEILQYQPQGLVLTNGPGDPSELPLIVETIKELYPLLPTLGICLGHQLLALAAGGQTYKLPFGHRGGNHPVQNVLTGETTMTAQNHGYAVREESMVSSGFKVISRNLNDGTIEGLEHIHYPVFSVQYHPEASPGPEENAEIFSKFIAKLK